MTPEKIMIAASLVSAIAVVANLVWTVYWAIQVREQVKAAKNDDRFKDHNERIIRLEATMDHLPARVASHDDVEVVHRRVTELRQKVDGIGDTVSAVAASVKSIDANLQLLNKSEFLTNRGKKQ
ncbi:MAG: hypothetical protein RH946_00695 [Rhodospirillales bacterium]